MASVFEHAWTLCFWWAAWTLTDRYLIRFTPWSEIAVLAVCTVTYLLAYTVVQKVAQPGFEPGFLAYETSVLNRYTTELLGERNASAAY